MYEHQKRLEIIQGFVPFRLPNGKDISYKGFMEMKGQPFYMVIKIPVQLTTNTMDMAMASLQASRIIGMKQETQLFNKPGYWSRSCWS